MPNKPTAEILCCLFSLLSALVFSLAASANSLILTQAELKQLDLLCAENSTAILSTTSKKKILLFHRDGYVPSIHSELPASVRAEGLDSAAVVLCLEDELNEIEVCNFNILFSIPREQYRYKVDAVALSASGNRLADAFIEAAEPSSCANYAANNIIDNTVDSIAGPPVSVNNILDFIDNKALDRQDNDRDGLRNLEEFKIGSDPENPGSPIAQALVKINGLTSSVLYEGETAEIRLDLFPGLFLGNAAEYYFWADLPDGQYTFQYPAGFKASNIIDPILSAPLVRLFNFRLFRLKNLDAGEYQFYFEARDNNGSIDLSTAKLSVIEDSCRENVSLPLSISDSWSNNCDSLAGQQEEYLARYYTFSLDSQSDLTLELLSSADAEIILRDGSGRSGYIIDSSESNNGNETLSTTLDSGTYTLEIMLEDSSASGTSFQLASSNQIIPWQFTEVTLDAGINHSHGYLPQDIDDTDPSYERILQGAGVASGDYDQDGWIDLYVTRGSIGPNLLYRNLGNGSFVDMAESAGVALDGRKDAGATFADVDGDGWPDLFIGGVNGTKARLYRNKQNGTFENITSQAGLAQIDNSFSASFADYDKDGDLDLYLAHWNDADQGNYLFQNDGNAKFTDISASAGIPNGLMADYTPIFADINNDGWLDLLVAADFSTSQVYINDQDGSFTLVTDNEIITDDNGMGAAAGDYDNDGDIDWFVSSIFDPRGIPNDVIPGANTGASGNRLYKNAGDGTFEDVTDAAGVKIGGWGWGSCFADFNNDGWLDIFHVNGYVTANFTNNAVFLTDGSRFYISNQDGTFTGREQELNFSDTGQGRGIVCFDYDLDGDIDVFVANNQQAPALYRNDGGNDQNFLTIKISGEDLNSEAIGARVYLTTGEITQMREIYAGSNFISNNPSEAYFGLGDHTVINELRVVWPSGEEKVLTDIPANQMLTIFK